MESQRSIRDLRHAAKPLQSWFLGRSKVTFDESSMAQGSACCQIMNRHCADRQPRRPIMFATCARDPAAARLPRLLAQRDCSLDGGVMQDTGSRVVCARPTVFRE